MKLLRHRVWIPQTSHMPPTGVIIAGSRWITDYPFCRDLIDSTFPVWGLEKTSLQAVISGGARGPDTLGERWAVENGIPVKQFLPDWDKHKKAAGIIRNAEMADFAAPHGAAIVLWDGTSRGAADMIRKARKKSLWLSIFVLSA